MGAEVLPASHRLARITSRTEVCVEYRTPSGHSAMPSGRANPVCGYPVHIDFPHVEVRAQPLTFGEVRGNQMKLAQGGQHANTSTGRLVGCLTDSYSTESRYIFDNPERPWHTGSC